MTGSNDFLATLRDQISARLGAGWTSGPEIGGGRATLAGPDGAALVIAPDRKKAHHLLIHAVFPSTSNYRQASHTIGVGAGRGDAAITAEITRRLLPGYLPELAKALEIIRQRTEDDERRARLTERIYNLLPQSIRYRAGNSLDIQMHAQRWRGVIRFDGGDSARVELTNVSAQQLVKLIHALTTADE